MPNTVVKLTNAESTWPEAAREDRKLLIKKKHIRQDVLFACFHLVQGSGLSWRLRRLFDWAMPESGFLVTGYQS